MDQGMAAVVAGVVGMVGALIGAIAGARAAVRGAQIGGAKAVEAAQLQVDGQAAAGHVQWVRGQRQQAYAKLLDAHSAVEEVLLRVAPGIRRGGRLETDDRRELASRILVMQSCTSQLALWGPEDVTHVAQLLRAKTVEAAQALTHAQSNSPQDPAGPDSRWGRWEQESRYATALRTRFLELAGATVRDPRQSVI